MPEREPRCPYCVVEDEFYPMTPVAHGRLICQKCGHIIFPNDTAFRCPCPECIKITLSPRIRRLRPR